ncbi:helicase-related protein [Roseovarius amoyensis]|uniref:helicase-related protein n=1 Tax=Roseovarius amoyensis TaxID=2211448 RepID=UPI000DBE548E|nr:helicase-related protein [Roseovarius amoyensis]
MAERSRVLAVLGPTNTGKTHYAIERMLGYRTGVIGLPLRLLAREVYERIKAVRGPSVVALVTGEERIVPDRARYWVCTVEAMPEGLGTDFVAIDEIQLCADPERGHVFTDRLLQMRGQHETQFLGAETMRGAIAALVPGVEFLHRERMSQLSYTGPRKISRMPPRSAIVGFSVENVYAIAELIRRQKGGAAVVMGALSPRTRNAQVELYQNGDVDYLVATDAIGMGLNLDIDHVAFSALTKFDGRRMRTLAPNELAQIAGRAGRGMRDGTFGVTGEAPDLDGEVAQAIVDHRFAPVRKLEWRNRRLVFGNVDALIASLEERPEDERLTRAREADDMAALRTLAAQAETRARASDAPSVRLLWDVCRIPDFRGISHAEHAGLLGTIFCDLHQHGRIRRDWFAEQIRRIDRTDGGIDALSKRLAYIRTWTYVAQRKGWVDDESHWREATRAVEDRLSDALHGALTQRFVDRRTSVLMRRLKQKEAIVAEVNDTGEVTVEGEFVGRLEGFRFVRDKTAAGQEAKTVEQAGLQALAPHFHLRADRFYNAPDTEIDFTEQGGLMWGSSAVGKLVQGSDPLTPRAVGFVDEAAGPDVTAKVERRLQHFIDRKIATLFEPLNAISKDETLSGLARGFGFRLIENFGIIPRGAVAAEVKALDQEARGQLRKHGVRFGQFTIFMPLLLKPGPTRLRLVLWGLQKGLDEFPEAPPPGLVTVPAGTGQPEGYFAMAGYRAAGERAIRIDMLERLADMLRAQDSRAGFEATADMLSITGMTLEQFAGLMTGLGYRAERGEREKVKPVDQAIVDAPADAAAGAEAEAAETQTAKQVVEEIADQGEAPLAAEPTEPAEVAPDIAATPDDELPPGATPAETAEPEQEVFYTFTWAGRARNARPGQAQGRDDKAPRGRKGGKPGNKPGGKPRGKPGGKPEHKGARTYSARPEKKDRIDPDNPFAAALMGLRDKT